MRLLNRDTDYAVRALVYIAKDKNKTASVSEISRQLGIPYYFLRKILRILNKKGIVTSYEGRDGGFRLAIPANKIFLVDLIKAFQGPVKLSDCLFRKSICPDVKNCLLKERIDKIEELVISELKTITVASLGLDRRNRRRRG